MRPFEIRNAIESGLESPGTEYWVGMCEKDRNDLVIEVQRSDDESLGIRQVIATIMDWAKLDAESNQDRIEIDCQSTAYGSLACVRRGSGGPAIHTTDYYVYSGDAWRAAMAWIRENLGIDYTKQTT